MQILQGRRGNCGENKEEEQNKQFRNGQTKHRLFNQQEKKLQCQREDNRSQYKHAVKNDDDKFYVPSSDESINSSPLRSQHQTRKKANRQSCPSQNHEGRKNESRIQRNPTQKTMKDKLTEFTRINSQCRVSKVKRTSGKSKTNRAKVPSETFSHQPNMPSEIQNSLAILEKAKQQNEKYALQKSVDRVKPNQDRNTITHTYNKESLALKNNKDLKSELRNDDLRVTMPDRLSSKHQELTMPQNLTFEAKESNYGNTFIEREASKGVLHDISAGRILKRSYFNNDIMKLKKGAQHKSQAQLEGVQSRSFRGSEMHLPLDIFKEQISSPPSNLLSPRESSDQPQLKKKGSNKRLVTRPIYKITNNIEKHQKAIIIPSERNKRSKANELQKRKINTQKQFSLGNDIMKEFHRGSKKFLGIEKPQKQTQSPRISKLTKNEIKRIRREAAQAELKYRSKYLTDSQSSTRVQKDWKDPQEDHKFNIKLTEETGYNNYDEDNGNIDSCDDLTVETDTIRVPIVHHEAPGRNFEANYDTCNSQIPGFTPPVKQKLLAFFKGWKTRRILRNQHLKELKTEIGYMLKLRQNDLDEEELKQCQAEFDRIARKFCDIFTRLWNNREWIKPYNRNMYREKSLRRDQSITSKARSGTKCQPVFETSHKNLFKSDPESSIEIKETQNMKYQSLSSKDKQDKASSQNLMLNSQSQSRILVPHLADVDRESETRQDKINMIFDIQKHGIRHKGGFRNQNLNEDQYPITNNSTDISKINKNLFKSQWEVLKPEIRARIAKSSSMIMNHQKMYPDKVEYNQQMYPDYSHIQMYNNPSQYQVDGSHTQLGMIPRQLEISHNQIGSQSQIMQPVYQYQGFPGIQNQAPRNAPVYVIYQGQSMEKEENKAPSEPFTRPYTNNSPPGVETNYQGQNLGGIMMENFTTFSPEAPKASPVVPKDGISDCRESQTTQPYPPKGILKKSYKEELSFMDTFPSQIKSEQIRGTVNYADDRPIHPQKTSPDRHTTFYEKKTEVPIQKSYLKRGKVYDPKESIQKEKALKRKSHEEKKQVLIIKRNSSTPHIASDPKKSGVHMETSVFDNPDMSKPTSQANQLSANKFVYMNQQQRVQKISQILGRKKA